VPLANHKVKTAKAVLDLNAIWQFRDTWLNSSYRGHDLRVELLAGKTSQPRAP
jgi:hypothetical protein